MIRVFDDLESLSRAAARLFAEEAEKAVAERDRFCVALSGGSTPHRTYEILASESFRGRVPWHGVHIFWGDERCVPPDHPQSNARMARQALLDHVPLLPGNVHPVSGERLPAEAAGSYETELCRLFSGRMPRFDLIFLGMGSDGHTASLFPGGSALQERKRWAVEAQGPSGGPPRVTLTLPVLNEARLICFLVAGGNKAKTLARVIRGSNASHPLPAQRVVPWNGELFWYVDSEAAAQLGPSAAAGAGAEEKNRKDSTP